MTAGLVDLHLHTTASDGYHTVPQLIEKITKAGIIAFSITDHDTFDAIDEAEEIARDKNLTFIPGIELSAYHEDREVHILAYYVDQTAKDFVDLLKYFKQERTHRAERILIRLKQHGMTIGMDEVMIEANGAPVTRPHIASLMLKKDYVKTFQEAFYSYLSNNASCFEPKVNISPALIFETIMQCGGVSFIAHPYNFSEDVLLYFINAGVDGLEVNHPSLSGEQRAFLKKLAKSYFLLTSGGSDFHGGQRDDYGNLGKFSATLSDIAAMKQRLSDKKPD